MLADMESLEKRLPATEKKAKGDKDPTLGVQIALMQRSLALLQDGKPARLLEVTPDEQPIFEQIQLLIAKPMLYVCVHVKYFDRGRKIGP